jgi:hypothetical protein
VLRPEVGDPEVQQIARSRHPSVEVAFLEASCAT